MFTVKKTSFVLVFLVVAATSFVIARSEGPARPVVAARARALPPTECNRPAFGASAGSTLTGSVQQMPGPSREGLCVVALFSC